MGEVNKQFEGSQKPAVGKDGDIPETHEVTLKIRIPKQPNKAVGGSEFPVTAILVFADGGRWVYPVREAKPSKASQRLNAWGGGRNVLDDGTQVLVGINITVME